MGILGLSKTNGLLEIKTAKKNSIQKNRSKQRKCFTEYMVDMMVLVMQKERGWKPPMNRYRWFVVCGVRGII
jgi:hypothetical protein